MAAIDPRSENMRLHNQDADYEAVNSSATFMFLVAIVAIMVAVPLALFF